jgi:hypothetical protein
MHIGYKRTWPHMTNFFDNLQNTPIQSNVLGTPVQKRQEKLINAQM